MSEQSSKSFDLKNHFSATNSSKHAIQGPFFRLSETGKVIAEKSFNP